MAYQTIAQAKTFSMARSLEVALRAYGFHPLEPSEGGLPGVPNLFGPEGFPVQVPEEEAGDAAVLAQDLLAEMTAEGP